MDHSVYKYYKYYICKAHTHTGTLYTIYTVILAHLDTSYLRVHVRVLSRDVVSVSTSWSQGSLVTH